VAVLDEHPLPGQVIDVTLGGREHPRHFAIDTILDLIKALIEHFLHLGTRRAMTLYWGARNAAELYLRNLPEIWTTVAPSLRFVPVISEDGHATRHGFVHEAVLEDHPDLSAFDVYMSGPPALIDAGRRAFVAASLPEDRLFYDSFDYAPDVLAAILRGRAGIAES
jgi:CDP-4-dehydro-6-deoxyglucose reductase